MKKMYIITMIQVLYTLDGYALIDRRQIHTCEVS